MAYTVNWATGVVTIPKTDLSLVSASPEIYELSVLDFWVNIHDIQDGEGMPYLDIMSSNAPTSFGPRGVLIVNGYRVEFEDGPYQVNLTQANSDIEVNRIQNNVSINNKVVNGLDAAAIAAAVWGEILGSATAADKLTEIWRLQGLDAANPMTVTPTSRAAGDISQTISGDGETTSTVTRQ